MARPMKRRRICALPPSGEFAPATGGCGCVEMTLDEFEALRLIDQLGLTQEDCAAQMNVARTTVQAICTAARGKVADALVNGKRLRIAGGNYEVCPEARRCCGSRCAHRGCAARRCEEAPAGGCPCCAAAPEES